MSSWYHLSLCDTTLFTAFLFGAISHWRIHWHTKGKPGEIFRPQDQEMLVISESESIKEVNKAIQDPSRALSDAVILSVICLANNRGDELLWDEDLPLPFQPPLQGLQWLDIYGSLLSNPIHLAALAQLIKLRGGLERIKLPGLAPILS
jgi:hypothetical protein